MFFNINNTWWLIPGSYSGVRKIIGVVQTAAAAGLTPAVCVSKSAFRLIVTAAATLLVVCVADVVSDVVLLVLVVVVASVGASLFLSSL